MKKLIIRLSSLGDVILASAALEGATGWDWAIAEEYSALLSGHPQMNQLWKFKRQPGLLAGLQAWLNFCHLLWLHQYDEIYDLHRTHRTRVMKLAFLFWDLQARFKLKSVHCVQWKTISKQRIRLYGYFIFKKFWPWPPTPWLQRYVACVGGSLSALPNLKHLLLEKLTATVEHPSASKGYLCVMPSSKWQGKEWPTKNYAQVLKNTLGLFPVILGTGKDEASQRLVQELQEQGVPHASGVGRWNLIETAQILAASQGYLGGDTGIAHLAQAVGVRATVIYGPTTPEVGFAWPAAVAVQENLWCRPCGKDGRWCYRFDQKYACLASVTPQHVTDVLKRSDRSWERTPDLSSS